MKAEVYSKERLLERRENLMFFEEKIMEKRENELDTKEKKLMNLVKELGVEEGILALKLKPDSMKNPTEQFIQKSESVNPTKSAGVVRENGEKRLRTIIVLDDSEWL